MLRVENGNRPFTWRFVNLTSFEPGMIISFSDIYGGVYNPGCSSIMGVIDDVKNAVEDTTAGSGRVTVWSTPGTVFKTDQFMEGEYVCGGEVYANYAGYITDEVGGGRVGYVITPPDKDGLLTFVLNISNSPIPIVREESDYSIWPLICLGALGALGTSVRHAERYHNEVVEY